MDESESLSHSKWECKYHIIFIPKCRRKTLYEQLRPHLGEVFKRLAEYKGSRIEEGPFDAGSCTHANIDPTEICGVSGCRLHKEQECDSSSAGIRRAQAQLCGAAFLGERVLCIDGGTR
jgi:putative transposase